MCPYTRGRYLQRLVEQGEHVPIAATVKQYSADVVLGNGSCGKVDAVDPLQGMIPADWANDGASNEPHRLFGLGWFQHGVWSPCEACEVIERTA